MRRRPSHIFQLCYTDLCSLHNIPMIFPIKTHLHKRMLDFNGDRVKLDEWRPILKALSMDRSLHLIAIRSKNACSKVLEHIDSETKSRTVVKLPVLLTSFIFRRLVTSLSRCLSYNSHLKCLELDGLLLSGDYLQTLLAGLKKSTSLQHLSLHRCPLGDDGCRSVCDSLRNLPNILTVDMSGCNISEKGAHYIAKALQYQNLNRYGENWKQSLRCRIPDTDMMPGLRRVTLNHNPSIGDSGVEHILSVLRDDLWLKALDLQNVGLTNIGGKEVLDLLGVNKSLSVLDVHNNPDVDKSVYESIMNMLATNNLGKTSEFHWIQEDTLCLPRRPSYQSRDPSFVQRPLREHDATNLETCSPSGIQTTIRLTQSTIIPRVSDGQVLVAKTRSASAMTTQGTNVVDTKAYLKTLPNHPFGTKQRATKRPINTSKWDYTNAHGDVDCTPHLRAKLQELSSKLQEETEKRLEAEKQKSELELKLEKLSHAQEGHILMDENIVKEITEAFAVFSYFVDIFSKRGLQLETAESSEGLSDQGLSDMMSIKSPSLSLHGDFQMGGKDDPDGASSLAPLLSSLSIKEWKGEINNKVSCPSEGPPQIAVTEIIQHPDSCGECENAGADVTKQQGGGMELDFVPPNGEAIIQPQSQLQKVLGEIFFPSYPTMQTDNLLKIEALSYNSTHQDDISQKSLISSASVTPRNECRSGNKNRDRFGFHAESMESLYANAEQAVNDQEDSWITELCWSSDASPCSTLTELIKK